LRRRGVGLDLFLAQNSKDNDKIISNFKSLLANGQSLRVDNLAANLGPLGTWRRLLDLLIFLVRGNTLTDGIGILWEADLGSLENTLQRLFVLFIPRRGDDTDCLVRRRYDNLAAAGFIR